MGGENRVSLSLGLSLCLPSFVCLCTCLCVCLCVCINSWIRNGMSSRRVEIDSDDEDYAGEVEFVSPSTLTPNRMYFFSFFLYLLISFST